MVSSNTTFYLDPLILLLYIFTYLTCSQLLYLSCVCFLFFHGTNMLYSSSLSSLFWTVINITCLRSQAQNEKRLKRVIHNWVFYIAMLDTTTTSLAFPWGLVATVIYHEVFTVTSERQCPFSLFFSSKAANVSKMVLSPLGSPDTQKQASQPLVLLLFFLITAAT